MYELASYVIKRYTSHTQRFLAFALPPNPVFSTLQVYELASYLIKRYTGSGKTFFLAAEQGDLQMRQQPTGKAAAAAAVTAATPLDAERQEMLGKMWWEQQAAVDDARVDAADKLKGVQVGLSSCCFDIKGMRPLFYGTNQFTLLLRSAHCDG